MTKSVNVNNTRVWGTNIRVKTATSVLLSVANKPEEDLE
jgi:hypothetical protein